MIFQKSRILFTCNTSCNISELFKFQWYFKKMSSCFRAIMKFMIIKLFIKFSLLRLLWRQFSRLRYHVCNTYLNARILVNWFRRVMARAHAIARLFGQRMIISFLFLLANWTYTSFEKRKYKAREVRKVTKILSVTS